MSKPCVMDIKIGKITYGPDASQEKKDRESKSYAGTKLPYGYSVCGIIVHSDQVKVATTAVVFTIIIITYLLPPTNFVSSLIFIKYIPPDIDDR